MSSSSSSSSSSQEIHNYTLHGLARKVSLWYPISLVIISNEGIRLQIEIGIVSEEYDIILSQRRPDTTTGLAILFSRNSEGKIRISVWSFEIWGRCQVTTSSEKCAAFNVQERKIPTITIRVRQSFCQLYTFKMEIRTRQIQTSWRKRKLSTWDEEIPFVQKGSRRFCSQ